MNINKAARLLASLGGKARAIRLSKEARKEIARKGGKARMSKLTPEQRSEIARKAGKAGGRGRKKVE